MVSLLHADITSLTQYRVDDTTDYLVHERVAGSHIKIFIPTIPYMQIFKLVNGTLLRSSENEQGWEFMMATSYKKIDDKTYEFILREGVLFQDGTPFNADSVIENFAYFQKEPFVYSDIHKRLEKVVKVSDYKVRFYFSKPYGLFFHDLTSINLYTSRYLKEYGWSSGDDTKYNCNSTQAAGPWGLGPYILAEGYATGRHQTPIVHLVANPYYYEKGMPYIENITVYTELKTLQALDLALNKESIDIMPIPFNKKIETILSPYARLYIKPSAYNILNYFNLLKPHGVLKNQKIRIALNKAINQADLLNFVYKKEGFLSPTETSVNYSSIRLVAEQLLTWGEMYQKNKDQEEDLKTILQGLHLKVVTTDYFMFLWKGIEYQLKKYGVTLEYDIVKHEKEAFTKILTNREHPQDWDILTLGIDDWYSKNPWSTFLMYRITNGWSTIDKDDVMQAYLEHYFDLDFPSKAFNDIVEKITRRSYEQAYMLFVPSPNLLLAVNKEIYYEPASVLLMPLWKAKLTRFHWSIRGNEAYPKDRERSMKPVRYYND